MGFFVSELGYPCQLPHSPDPWSRPELLSITLHSARLLSTRSSFVSSSWTKAECRACVKVWGPRDEGCVPTAGWLGECGQGNQAGRTEPGRCAEHWGARGSCQTAPPPIRSQCRPATHAQQQQQQCPAFPSSPAHALPTLAADGAPVIALCV